MLTQQFGSINVGEAEYYAMLCRDSDEADRALISWWKPNQASSGKAILARFIEIDIDVFRLELGNYFQTDESGTLFLPQVTADQWADFSSYQVTLRQRGDRLEGEISHPQRRQLNGKIQFAGLGNTNQDLWEVKRCDDWEDFKRWAAEIRRDDKGAAFRGQGSNKFGLQSTIHRYGRTRFERYFHETIGEFRNHVEAILGITFDIYNSNDHATLLGLAQHHGLPTPLLDFTDSPYIAAYFAFSDAVENQRHDVTHVRIFAIRGDYLTSVAQQRVVLSSATPYISSLSLSARHNPRLYAQQGRFLITNVSNLEVWLRAQHLERPVLSVADVPVACAATALEDLKYMGLTAGTLFPGLDGICRMMKQTIILNEKSRNHVQLSPLTAATSTKPLTNSDQGMSSKLP